MKEKWIKFLDHGVEYGLYGLIFFIPISKSAIEILFAFCLFFFLLKKMLKPDFKFPWRSHHVFLLLFILFYGLSLLNSGPYLQKSLRTLFFKWVEYILIFLMVEDTLSRPARLRNAVAVLLFAGVLIGLDGLSQRFLGIEFLRQRNMVWIDQGFYGMTASFSHYNDFGSYLIVVLLLAVALFISGRVDKIKSVILFLVMVLLGSCLLLSFSRGSWFGFLSGLGLMLAVSRRKRPLFLIMFASIVPLLLFSPLRERVLFIFQTNGTSERLPLLKVAWRMVTENPFLGKGAGTFMDYCSRYTSGLFIRYAHNCYLQMWAEAGIFALLSFLIFAGVILRKGVYLFKREADVAAFAFTCAIFGFLIHSILDTNLYSLQLSVLFWSMGGLLASRFPSFA